jgi:hypothetical protein
MDDRRDRKGSVKERLKYTYLGATNLYDVNESNRVSSYTDTDSVINYQAISQEREYYTRLNNGSAPTQEMYSRSQPSPTRVHYMKMQTNN